MRWTILLALLPTLALAQSQTAPRPEDLGTVTGHITCSDTQRPARLAQVDLVPIKSAEDPDLDTLFKNLGKYGPVHTDTTGTYSLTDVPPGQYYLRVGLDGYITPVDQFTGGELHAPTPEVQQRIQHELQFVTVTPNATTHADATLRRAASISGKVIYDDGSPAIGLNVRYLFRDAKGKFLRAGWTFHTDSHGRYDIDSLPPDDYIIQVSLDAMERRPGTATFGDLRSKEVLVDEPVFSLPVYSGSVFREKAAVIVKVDEGQETDGIDITIPLGRLHKITGTLFAKDGHAINNGTVDLLFADTQEPFTATDARDNGTFDLRFIPDGNYIIKVTDASDYETIDAPAPSPGSPTQVNRHLIRSYGDLQQPLTVQTSDQSLTLTVPDAPATPPADSTDDN